MRFFVQSQERSLVLFVKAQSRRYVSVAGKLDTAVQTTQTHSSANPRTRRRWSATVFGLSLVHDNDNHSIAITSTTQVRKLLLQRHSCVQLVSIEANFTCTYRMSHYHVQTTLLHTVVFRVYWQTTSSHVKLQTTLLRTNQIMCSYLVKPKLLEGAIQKSFNVAQESGLYQVVHTLFPARNFLTS